MPMMPELRGFEKFCEGRPVEELPRLTPRICGVCPEAHHMAATKALDDLFHVDPPPAAKKLRELFYSIFYATDHTTHFYALGGPDFVVGPTAPAAQRNILGVVAAVGMDVAGRVLKMRRDGHELIKMMGGRRVHPNWGLPGGVSKGLKREDVAAFQLLAEDGVAFAQWALAVAADASSVVWVPEGAAAHVSTDRAKTWQPCSRTRRTVSGRLPYWPW